MAVTIARVKVSDLLKSITSSCDYEEFDGSPESWMCMINMKASDEGFEDLVDSLLDDGFAEESSIAVFRGGRAIWNGHHRLVAAILLGMDEVNVSDSGSDGGREIDAHGDNMGGSANSPYFSEYSFC